MASWFAFPRTEQGRVSRAINKFFTSLLMDKYLCMNCFKAHNKLVRLLNYVHVHTWAIKPYSKRYCNWMAQFLSIVCTKTSPYFSFRHSHNNANITLHENTFEDISSCLSHQNSRTLKEHQKEMI